MKLLYLTAIQTVPTEEGQKRIDRALKKSKSEEDDFAKPGTSRWFKDMGITPPDDLEEEEETDEITEDGFMFMSPEEVEYEFSDLLLPLKDFGYMQDDPIYGSILVTQNGDSFHIEETVEEINWYIHYLQRPWYIKIKDYLKEKFTNKNKQLN